MKQVTDVLLEVDGGPATLTTRLGGHWAVNIHWAVDLDCCGFDIIDVEALEVW